MDGLRAIRTTARKRQARDWSLVLSSQGLAHDVVEGTAEWTLYVAEEDVLKALRELSLYDQENRSWPWVEELPMVSGSSWLAVTAWVAMLVGMDLLARSQAFGLDWFASGRVDSGRILGGEWWRTITALTLHSGLGHLLSNALWGGLFVALAGESVGAGFACALALVSGAAGNALNVMFQGAGHVSLGASTSVFGVLGVLAGARFRARSLRGSRLWRRFAPVVAATFLFLFSGVGGVDPKQVLASRIDVEAHLGGFLAGLILGACLQPLASRFQASARKQGLVASLALALLALAWFAASRAQGHA